MKDMKSSIKIHLIHGVMELCKFRSFKELEAYLINKSWEEKENLKATNGDNPQNDRSDKFPEA